jgi:FKBP-type peptidyl-prolyl cis-trans isomerase FklB
MKKMFFAAVAAIAMLSACNNSNPQASFKSDIDSLSYEIGLAYSEQAKMPMLQGVVDSAFIDDLLKGIKEGTMVGDDMKKKAYMIGLSIGMNSDMQVLKNIEQAAFGNDSTKQLSRLNYLAGLADGLKGTSTYKLDSVVVDSRQAYMKMSERIEDLRAKALQEEYAEEKEKNEAFMDDNSQKEGVLHLSDGVQYKVLKEGKGAIPTIANSVKVKYEGRLINGEVFDSSVNQPDGVTTFPPLSNLIKGMQVALTKMPVGSEWEIYIPWHVGYGVNGQRGIPPFSTLIFKVTLVEIVK